MPDQNKLPNHRFWLGGILVLLGFLFLLDSLGLLAFGNILSTWWPLVLIIIGLRKLLAPNGSGKGFGLALLILGLVTQLANLNLLDWGVISRYWPVILILIGFWILRKSGITGKSGDTVEKCDLVDAFVIFGGFERKITSRQFRGGEATAIMGGIELDLRAAQLIDGKHQLQVNAIMGGIDIIVPESWDVQVTGTPIMGGIEDNSKRTSGTQDLTETGLAIKGFALMGGIEVRN